MNRVFKYSALVALSVLAGCATSPALTQAEIEELHKPLTCKDKNECDLLWQHAQVWLSANSGYRIQSATDTVISTYGPMNNSPTLAYQITKIPDGSGGARIAITGGCANIFGCIPRLENAALDFKRYVLGNKPGSKSKAGIITSSSKPIKVN